ncbi:hypothetical protein HDV02_006013 [Globomyces sp. JEL0801]|nr:hypothetical protein HDV02_006013 [Globomyces sp. JEL0801]
MNNPTPIELPNSNAVVPLYIGFWNYKTVWNDIQIHAPKRYFVFKFLYVFIQAAICSVGLIFSILYLKYVPFIVFLALLVFVQVFTISMCPLSFVSRFPVELFSEPYGSALHQTQAQLEERRAISFGLFHVISFILFFICAILAYGQYGSYIYSNLPGLYYSLITYLIIAAIVIGLPLVGILGASVFVLISHLREVSELPRIARQTEKFIANSPRVIYRAFGSTSQVNVSHTPSVLEQQQSSATIIDDQMEITRTDSNPIENITEEPRKKRFRLFKKKSKKINEVQTCDELILHKEEAVCVVCLAEYTEAEELLQLGVCHHHFHGNLDLS